MGLPESQRAWPSHSDDANINTITTATSEGRSVRVLDALGSEVSEADGSKIHAVLLSTGVG
jgi:hypothetical protein